MKTLKGSILSRSSHGAKEFEAQRRELIEDWLKKYDIENYNINDDFTIDVDDDVNLVRKNLMEFPDYIQFGVVSGYFSCSYNNLTSLRGAPKKVEWYFDCNNNYLTSLEGAPEKVKGGFYCSSNQLTTLEGSPKEVGSFNCERNKLTTLKGAPKKVGGDFYCNLNQLTSLEGAPKEVGGYFDCSNNFILFSVDDAKKVCRVKRTIIVK